MTTIIPDATHGNYTVDTNTAVQICAFVAEQNSKGIDSADIEAQASEQFHEVKGYDNEQVADIVSSAINDIVFDAE